MGVLHHCHGCVTAGALPALCAAHLHCTTVQYVLTCSNHADLAGTSCAISTYYASAKVLMLFPFCCWHGGCNLGVLGLP